MAYPNSRAVLEDDGYETAFVETPLKYKYVDNDAYQKVVGNVPAKQYVTMEGGPAAGYFELRDGTVYSYYQEGFAEKCELVKHEGYHLEFIKGKHNEYSQCRLVKDEDEDDEYKYVYNENPLEFINGEFLNVPYRIYITGGGGPASYYLETKDGTIYSYYQRGLFHDAVLTKLENSKLELKCEEGKFYKVRVVKVN